MLSFLRKSASSLSLLSALERAPTPVYHPDVDLPRHARPTDPTLARPTQAPFVCYAPVCLAYFCPTYNPYYPPPAAGPFQPSASLSALASRRPLVPQFECYATVCKAKGCPQHGRNLTATKSTNALPELDIPQVVLFPPSPGLIFPATESVQNVELAFLVPTKPLSIKKPGDSGSRLGKSKDKENEQETRIKQALTLRKGALGHRGRRR